MTPNGTGARATIACATCGKLNRVDMARAADGPRCGACRKPLRLDRPIQATDGSFDRIVGDSEVPILVDFHAEWCGPCKMMAPILDEVAQSWRGRALVVKVDTDHNPGVAARQGIRGVPTLALFSGGAEVQRQVGAVPKRVVEAMLEGV